MLQNLDKVNWVELGAAQMPNILQKIQSDQIEIESDKERQNAWDELRELLYPEGIIDNWDWSGPGRIVQNDLPHQTVPFLIAILKQTTSKSTQMGIIGLLWQLSTYSSVKLWVGEPGDPKYESFVEWEKRLKDIIRQELPYYQVLADNPNPYLSKDANDLLQKLDEE